MIMNAQINRPMPSLAPQFFSTYEVTRPVSTHFRKATCQEVDCPNYARGWKTTIDTSTALGAQQATYIRMKSGRSFTFEDFGTLVIFTFAAGQRCFSQHRMPLDREPFFRKLAGDWRHYEGARTLRARDWLDDFAEHQDNLSSQRQRAGVQ